MVIIKFADLELFENEQVREGVIDDTVHVFLLRSEFRPILELQRGQTINEGFIVRHLVVENLCNSFWISWFDLEVVNECDPAAFLREPTTARNEHLCQNLKLNSDSLFFILIHN